MQESVKSLTVLEKGTLEEKLALLIASKLLAGLDEAEIIGSVAADKQEIANALSALGQKKTVLRVDSLYVHGSHLADFEKRVLQVVGDYHKANPLKPGIDKEELKGLIKLRFHPRVLAVTVDGMVKRKLLEAEGSKLKVPGFRAGMGQDQGELKIKIVDAIRKGGSQPPVREELPELFKITDKDARDLLKLLAEEGSISRVNDSIYLAKETLEKMRQDLMKYLQEKKEITVAEFRDLVKTSRKYAVPLMEHFDSSKITQRVGDKGAGITFSWEEKTQPERMLPHALHSVFCIILYIVLIMMGSYFYDSACPVRRLNYCGIWHPIITVIGMMTIIASPGSG
jgi:selenocysteine-specific elongation factor